MPKKKRLWYAENHHGSDLIGFSNHIEHSVQLSLGFLNNWKYQISVG